MVLLAWILSLTIWFNVYIDQRTLVCFMVGRKTKKRIKRSVPFQDCSVMYICIFFTSFGYRDKFIGSDSSNSLP